MRTYSFIARGKCGNKDIKRIVMKGYISSNLENESDAFFEAAELALIECQKLEPTFYIPTKSKDYIQYPNLKLLKNKK